MKRLAALLGILLMAGGIAGLVLDRPERGDAAACRSAFKPLISWNADVIAIGDKTKTISDVLPLAAPAQKKVRAAATLASDGSFVQTSLESFADDIARVRVAWLDKTDIDTTTYVSDATKVVKACKPLDSRW